MEEDIPLDRLEEIQREIATMKKPVKKESPLYVYPEIKPIKCQCGKEYHPNNPPNVYGGFCWPCDLDLLCQYNNEQKPKKDEFPYEIAVNKLRSYHKCKEEKKRKIDTAFTPKSRLNKIITVNTVKKPKIVSKDNK